MVNPVWTCFISECAWASKAVWSLPERHTLALEAYIDLQNFRTHTHRLDDNRRVNSAMGVYTALFN